MTQVCFMCNERIKSAHSYWRGKSICLSCHQAKILMLQEEVMMNNI